MRPPRGGRRRRRPRGRRRAPAPAARAAASRRAQRARGRGRASASAGCSNPEIATRLVISRQNAEHRGTSTRRSASRPRRPRTVRSTSTASSPRPPTRSISRPGFTGQLATPTVRATRAQLGGVPPIGRRVGGQDGEVARPHPGRHGLTLSARTVPPLAEPSVGRSARPASEREARRRLVSRPGCPR